MSKKDAENGENINLTEIGNKTSPTHDGTSPMLDNEDYDPHIHRVIANPTTNNETLIHILKGSLGTGILAMPEAFKYSGYLNGIVSTILIGIICTYCLHVLVKAQYILCKRHRVPILTYPISMKIALEEGPPSLRKLAPIAIPIVDGFLIVYQLGICCVYIVFVAENIKQCVDYYFVQLSVEIHILILLLPLILLNCIRNLKLLAPFSTFANIITFVGIGLLMIYIFDDLPSVSSSQKFGELQNYPLFFGTTLFALEAVGVVIALENNMKTPKSFGGWFGVLNIGMTIITLMYAAMGFVGYLRYGDGIQASITFNIPETAIIAQSIRAIFAVAIFISYGLQCYVPVEIIWTNYLVKRYEGSDKKLRYEFAVRISVVIVTFLLAIAIPRLGLFITLFGALCLSVLGLAFPAIMEICVYWPDNFGRFNYVLWRNILIIIFGIIGLVAGTYTSVRAIIISFM